MGELLAGLLRGLVWLAWAVGLCAGLYSSGSFLTADLARARMAEKAAQDWRAGHQNVARAMLARRENWPTDRLAMEAAVNPSQVGRWIWALAKNEESALMRGTLLTPFSTQQVIWHMAVPLAVGVFLGLLFEFVAYPLARAGLARWLAQPDDAQAIGRAKSLARGDGFVLARDVRLDRPTSMRHVLTIGPSGSRKSAAQVIPSLLQLPDDCAAIATDVKYELVCRSGRWLRSRGHPVYVLSPDGGFGVGWDPLMECESSDDARALAQQILHAAAEASGQKSTEWLDSAKPLFSAYIIEAQARKVGLPDAFEAFYQGEAGQGWIQCDAAKFALAMFNSGKSSDRTVGSLYTTISQAVDPWTGAQVSGFLSHPERLDTRTIREQKAVVFLCSTASEMKTLAAVFSVFFQRIFSTFASQAGQPPCWLLLDEFANVGNIGGVSHALNLLRSAGVGIHALIQNPPQLASVYGHDQGALVRASFGTVSVLPGLRDGADEVGRWLGQREEIREAYSTADEQLRSNYSQNRNEILAADRIRQLPDDQVLIVSGNRVPVLTNTKPWYKIRKLRKRVPAAFRKDWGDVRPDDVRQELEAAGKIEPRTLKAIEPEAIEKKPTVRKPRKTVSISLADIAAAITSNGAMVSSALADEEPPMPVEPPDDFFESEGER